jgi:hypothetical protein
MYKKKQFQFKDWISSITNTTVNQTSRYLPGLMHVDGYSDYTHVQTTLYRKQIETTASGLQVG